VIVMAESSGKGLQGSPGRRPDGQVTSGGADKKFRGFSGRADGAHQECGGERGS